MLRGRAKMAYQMLPESSVVVDVGCAASNLADSFMKKSSIVLAVDVTFDALKKAKVSWQ